MVGDYFKLLKFKVAPKFPDRFNGSQTFTLSNAVIALGRSKFFAHEINWFLLTILIQLHKDSTDAEVTCVAVEVNFFTKIRIRQYWS